ncbi:MAG TPA: stage 0 sporulation family protein [Nitrospirota bacterium]|jgi:cell fate regulator YaaT (PSP1 superfamily)
MFNVVGVRYREGCKTYNFDSGEIELQLGDTVIVDSEQGVGVATVVAEVRQEERRAEDKTLKKVLRKASEEDQRRIEKNGQMEAEAFRICQQKIQEREMIMKLVRVEWSFDNTKATFYFTADGRVDFRDLVKDLAHRFRIRIEMRQIGVRDEAKMIGGYGPCGRSLCCSSFLKDFEPVSIRMAKKQDLVLNPAKISGICGRLMCCLGYEYSFYDEMKKDARKKKEAGDAPPEKREREVPAQQQGCGCGKGQSPHKSDGKSEGAAAQCACPNKTPVDVVETDEQGEKRKRKRSAWRKRRKTKPGEGGPNNPGGAPDGNPGSGPKAP